MTPAIVCRGRERRPETMAPLTLQALLASRGIYRPRDLAQVMEWSRQLAHVYWRGWTRRRRTPDGPLERVPVRLGREAATRLAGRLDLAIEDVLRAEPAPVPL